MDFRTLQSILTIGETIAVEFKRCGNGIESDTYETVCSFLNRFGRDIFLGVLNDGTVIGVPDKVDFWSSYYIQKLKKYEKIRRKGTSRKGRWEVL